MFRKMFREVSVFDYKEQVHDQLTYLFGLDRPAQVYFSSSVSGCEEDRHISISFYVDTFWGGVEVDGHYYAGCKHSYVLGLEPESTISFTTELYGFKFNFSSENLNVLSQSFRKSDYVMDLVDYYGIQNTAIMKVSCGVINGEFRIDMTIDW